MGKENFLFQIIYDDIKDLVVSGKLKKGDQVPSEKELCEKYGVSRITSKKALNMLQEDKIITRKGGLGSFVGSFSNEKSKSYKKIGLLLSGLNSTFGLDFLRYVEYELALLGYTVIVFLTFGSQEKEMESINFFLDHDVMGIICMPCFGKYYNPVIMKLAIEKFPILFVYPFIQKYFTKGVMVGSIKE